MIHVTILVHVLVHSNLPRCAYLSAIRHYCGQYQQRSTATYLKSDVLLNLAQQHIENAEYYTALSCLREIPATFQKYDCVPDLIEIASSERDRLIAEKEALRKKQAEADVQRKTAQSYARPSGGYMGFSETELQRLYNRFQREGYSSEDAILTVKGMLDFPEKAQVSVVCRAYPAANGRKSLTKEANLWEMIDNSPTRW